MAKERMKLAGVEFMVRTFDQFIDIFHTLLERDGVSFNFVNVHSLIEAIDNKEHYLALTNRSINLADGFPVAFMLSRRFGKFQKVSGPDVLQFFIENQEILINQNLLIVGGTEKVLKDLEGLFNPQLVNVRSIQPGFVNLDELDGLLETYSEEFVWSSLCFVGMGCPKQELLCRKIVDKFSCNAFAFGAAFDFVTGSKRRAPRLMQQVGLEWLHRLFSEPRRLFGRYMKTNARFILLMIKGVL